MMALLMLGCLCAVLLAGFPAAFTLAGVALVFAGFGTWFGTFDASVLKAFPAGLYASVTNPLLVAVPLFVFMGVTLEKSGVAEDLLLAMGRVFAKRRGGLAIAVCFVGGLLAASTGIVGASVVTMGLVALPSMLRQGYDRSLACGTIAASGTLGQIIPPSIVLILLGDQISIAYQNAQFSSGVFAPDTVTIHGFFAAALVPGLMLMVCYAVYVFCVAVLQPHKAPLGHKGMVDDGNAKPLCAALAAPLALIAAVLGSILFGFASTTEAASVGAMGTLLLALMRFGGRLRFLLSDIVQHTMVISGMIFAIVIGARLFSLVFRGFGGDELIEGALSNLPGGAAGAVFAVMVAIFIMGFFFEFLEILYIVVPVTAPILLQMEFANGVELDPLWLGTMIALNLQTSFLTPPFGLALFYLRGITGEGISTRDIYRGIWPYVLIQLFVLSLLFLFPILATGLPHFLDL